MFESHSTLSSCISKMTVSWREKFWFPNPYVKELWDPERLIGSSRTWRHGSYKTQQCF